MPPTSRGDPAPAPLQARTYIPVPAPTPVVVVSPVGEERPLGVAPLVGLADLIGMAVHGCGAPTTALSLPVWRSVLSSLLPPLVPSRRVHIPTCAGIGPIQRGTGGIGTIADLHPGLPLPAELFCSRSMRGQVVRGSGLLAPGETPPAAATGYRAFTTSHPLPLPLSTNAARCWPVLRSSTFIPPCEPALRDRLPKGEGWLYEVKHDGDQPSRRAD